MKIWGQYGDDRCDRHSVAQGGYVVLNAQSAQVNTYDGESIQDCQSCYITIYSGYLIYDVLTKEGEYLSPDFANELIRRIANESVVDLNLYNLAFFDAADIRPDSIGVRNEIDYMDYSTIPLEVVIVDK